MDHHVQVRIRMPACNRDALLGSGQRLFRKAQEPSRHRMGAIQAHQRIIADGAAAAVIGQRLLQPFGGIAVCFLVRPRAMQAVRGPAQADAFEADIARCPADFLHPFRKRDGPLELQVEVACAPLDGHGHDADLVVVDLLDQRIDPLAMVIAGDRAVTVFDLQVLAGGDPQPQLRQPMGRVRGDRGQQAQAPRDLFAHLVRGQAVQRVLCRVHAPVRGFGGNAARFEVVS